MTYQVIAECAHVTQDTMYGRAIQLVYKGALVADDAPELPHLIASGMVEKVGKDAGVGFNADGGFGPAEPPETPESPVEPEVKAGGGKKPAQSDPKSDWVEYAVSRGLSREESERSSKQDLIDALK